MYLAGMRGSGGCPDPGGGARLPWETLESLYGRSYAMDEIAAGSLEHLNERLGRKAVPYSDKEKNDIVKELEGKKYKIDRSKGLGENDPDMMWLTTMNPETRRLIKVMPEDAEATGRMFDLLLGDNLQGRKEHIANEGYKFLDLADIS